MDYSKLTLGELLSSQNPAIRRNATGILKQVQKCKHEKTKTIFDGFYRQSCRNCGMELLVSTAPILPGEWEK
jgi:hypothetical protein